MTRLACTLLLLGFAAFVSANAPRPPNVLLIYVDDLGYGDLASFGHPVIETPHLDRLASSGMRLTNYYAPSALCSPSRAALLTGRHPYRVGIRSWIPANSGIFLADEEITLAEVLNGVGYATALIGKWHLSSDLASAKEPQPNDQGFGYFYGHNAFQLPTNRDPTNIYRDKQALPAQQGYTADLYADEALRWLSKQNDKRPWFVMLSMAEPHTSIENPPAYNAMYSQFTQGEITPIPSGLPEPPKDKLIPRGPGEYYANITYMDAQLGRVLEWVEADEQRRSQTLVVFASDNGPVTSNWINWWEVNAYGSTGGYRGRKHFLYEGGIRVPAIVRYPGVTEAGSVSNELVVGTDLFNTIIAAAGADVPADRVIDGVDASTVLRGGSMPERMVWWGLPGELEFAVRKGPWKLMLNSEGMPRELYDLQSDPLELFNELQSQPEIVSRLKTLWEAAQTP